MATIEDHRERLLEERRWQALHELSLAALKWWRSRRPTIWKEEQHLAFPDASCTTPEEKELSEACAKVTRLGRQIQKERR